MNRYTIAVLVRNQFGVLNRVTSMFRRRQFNISALTVSETESNELSRITVVFSGEENKKQQLLIKMVNEPDTREEIRAAASAFGADTVDYAKDSMIFRLADTTRRIDDFLNFMKDYTILEICRTGCVSLHKGSTTIRQAINF